MIVFDIETGPQDIETLRSEFQPKTKEEFVGKQRWKPETADKKYQEYLDSAFDEHVKQAALSPITGKVLVIGYWQDNRLPEFYGEHDESEAQILINFWSRFEACRSTNRRMVGHNIFGFDLPFLLRRTWLLGLDPPEDVLRNGRYWDETFVDTMRLWSAGDPKDFVKLDTLAKAFGGNGKPDGIDGADFADLWESDQERAIEYLENDLRMVRSVADGMGVL